MDYVWLPKKLFVKHFKLTWLFTLWLTAYIIIVIVFIEHNNWVISFFDNRSAWAERWVLYLVPIYWSLSYFTILVSDDVRRYYKELYNKPKLSIESSQTESSPHSYSWISKNIHSDNSPNTP